MLSHSWLIGRTLVDTATQGQTKMNAFKQLQGSEKHVNNSQETKELKGTSDHHKPQKPGVKQSAVVKNIRQTAPCDAA
jgi:hypothetical protein